MRKILTVLLCALLLSGLVCCGQKSKEPTAAQLAARDELAQVFMAEIRDNVLPFRERPAMLANQGILVSREERVESTALLEGFLAAYQAGEDCALTACFVTKSFVVARIQVVDGSGYYFRYEYLPDEPIAVSSKHFDSIRPVVDEETGRVRLKLDYDKKEIATFTFRPKEGAGLWEESEEQESA